MKSLMALLGFAVLSVSANVPLEGFTVTDGKLTSSESGHLMINSGEFRATLKYRTEQKATLKFKYLGSSTEVAHLQNGEIRHQLGIKLKAQDICNLVYVMWNFDTNKILVSVKRNRGQKTSEECKDRGYRGDFKPDILNAPNTVRVDEWHSLSAELSDDTLTVSADRHSVWVGKIEGHEDIDGPVGIRSDNVHILLDYKVVR